VTAASSLISVFADQAGATTTVARPGRGSSPAAAAQTPALPTEPITFRGPRRVELLGAWPEADEPRGGVLVIHENRGLNDHIRSVAGRFAASGYSALAIDFLSREGGTDSFADPAQATAALSRVAPERFAADMTAGVTELMRRLHGRRLAVVGFCFGGGMVWLLLGSGERMSTTRSSTTPAPATTRPPRPPRTSACWTGSSGSSTTTGAAAGGDDQLATRRRA
jgi:carboxymethylenebutenolidase